MGGSEVVMGHGWGVWRGVALGLAVGLADWGLVEGLVFGFGVGSEGQRWVVLATFAVTYAGLGAVMEALWRARSRARQDAHTISQQLHALTEAHQRVATTERLATVGRLAAGVAHEVRNPLGVIRASAVLLRDAKGDPSERARAGQFIVDEVDRLNRYVGSLLNFSRPLTPCVRPVKVAPWLEDVASRALALDDVRGVEVRVSAQADALVELDEDLMGQVLLGLIVNAAQALSEANQRGEISVTHRREPAQDVLEVADQGPGLPQEVRAHLFEPFVTTRASGTGLGLAMARKVVEAHGAKILYSQDQSVGACFRIALAKR